MQTELRFKSLGKNVKIFPLAKIAESEVISIGNNVQIDDFVLMVGGQGIALGNYIHIASFSCIAGGGVLTMEDFSGLSAGCRIYTGTEDFLGGSLTNPTIPSQFRRTSRSFVTIKRHVILGANVIVMPGVTIGEGAAIGAGSLVLKDIEPWTVNVGSPAKSIKNRPKETILRMEQELLEKTR